MNFEKILQNLSKEKIFSQIFDYKVKEIILNNLPEKYSDFQKQKLIFIKDKILEKEVIFNLSRKKRPLPVSETKIENQDPFCNYQNETPFDELGRLENEFSVIVGNLSKMADYHSLVIFKKHDFDKLEENDFISAINLAKSWFQQIKNFDKEIKTEILIWNYHFRSGASILHPHLQLLAYIDIPLKVERLKEKLANYQKKYNNDYFEDYFYLTSKANLGKEENNLKIWVSLTPEKENGVNFYGDIFQGAKILWQTLKKFLNSGVQSFNLFYLLDLGYGFFVDRGEINKLNSDFGSLEIFGIKIVSSDPVKLAEVLF